MKRQDEEECRVAFHRFLCTLHEESAIQWEEGPEPPDFILQVEGQAFAVEVTTLMESHNIGSISLPLAAIRAHLCRFVETLETRAREAAVLHGCYLMYVSRPIQHFAAREFDVMNSLLGYIADTQAVESAAETVVIEEVRQRLTIQKLHAKADKVVLGGPSFFEWESEATVDARALLARVLEAKRKKLRDVQLPVILLIRDAYLFADTMMMRRASDELAVTSFFHTVFVVSDSSGFILQSSRSYGGAAHAHAEPGERRENT